MYMYMYGVNHLYCTFDIFVCVCLVLYMCINIYVCIAAASVLRHTKLIFNIDSEGDGDYICGQHAIDYLESLPKLPEDL